MGWRFRKFSPGRGKEFIYAARCSEDFRGPSKILGPLNGYQGFFSGVKPPGNIIEHFSLSRAKVRNEWSSTSTPLYAFMAWKGTRFLFLDIL
jgi:hypothetical protein